MEVKTGAIKAIINLGRTTKENTLKIKLCSGKTNEPGSTFKLMAIIAALEDNVIDEKSIVDTGKGELIFSKNIKLKTLKRRLRSYNCCKSFRGFFKCRIS